MMQDGELLRQYVEHGSQTAFAQLVERHLSLVYASCLREVRDPFLAEDVTQVVFLLLAHKAPKLREHTALAGWLFQTAWFASHNALRQEARRKRAEQKVVQEMATRPEATEVWWESIEPLLHRALTSLKPQEKEAVLLRFFEGLSVRETGEALGISEGAAQMRLSRAVEKLRRFFSRRGIALSTVALMGALSTRVSHAVPVTCHAAVLKVASSTVAGSLTSSALTVSVNQLTKGVLKAMWTIKVQTAMILASVSLVLLVGGSWVTTNGFARGSAPYNDPQSLTSVGDITSVEDPQLAQRVTVTAEGIPVGDLLAQVARKTGIHIEADEVTADDKVIVFGPARPLKEILADLAALYNDTWIHSSANGAHWYRLTRSVRAREYEKDLGAKRDQSLLAQLDAQIRALQETPEQLERRSPSDPIRQALENGSRLPTGIFALLSPEQRQQLMDNWRVRLPVSALSPMQKEGIEPLFHGALFEEANKDPDIVRGVMPAIREIPRSEMDQHEITFEILNASGVNRESSHMSIMLSAPSGFNMSVTNFSTGARFLFPPHGNPYPGQKGTENASLPDPSTLARAATGFLPDRLRTLSEQAGLPIMADYYRSKPVIVPATDETPAPQPAVHALNAFCHPEGYLWWNRGNTLLFRKRDWYNQRQYEIPDRWVLALSERLQAQKGVPTYADVLSLQELTTSQIVGLSESLGHSSDRRNLIGLREYLAVVKTMQIDKARPIYTGILSSPTENNLRRATLLPNPGDARQQIALRVFAQVFDPYFFKDPTLSEFGFLFFSPEAEIQQPGKNNAVNVQLHLYTNRQDGEGLRFGYVVALPKALPDDRRNKTRVELVR